MEGGRRKANRAKDATTPKVISVHVEKILPIINSERSKKWKIKNFLPREYTVTHDNAK